jgi:hypothetical protein
LYKFHQFVQHDFAQNLTFAKFFSPTPPRESFPCAPPARRDMKLHRHRERSRQAIESRFRALKRMKVEGARIAARDALVRAIEGLRAQ